MNNGYIKLSRSEKIEWLLKNYPNAFLLLTQIALRARRTSNSPDGYEIGEAHIGDFENAGIASRKAYRTALDRLLLEGAIKKVESCRTRKKSATGKATIGTKVKLLNSEFYDINEEYEGHIKGHRGATEGPPKGHEQECNKDKKEKKISNNVSLFPKRAENVFVSDEDHQKLVKELTAEFTQECYQLLSEWKINNPVQAKKFTSDIGRIKKWVITALREQKIKMAELDQREKRLKTLNGNSIEISANSSFSQKIFKEYHSQFYRMELNGDGIEFIAIGAAQQIPEMLKYNEKGFKEQLENILRKKGFRESIKV